MQKETKMANKIYNVILKLWHDLKKDRITYKVNECLFWSQPYVPLSRGDPWRQRVFE